MALGGERRVLQGHRQRVVTRQGLCRTLAHDLLGPNLLATESNILECEDSLELFAVLLFC